MEVERERRRASTSPKISIASLSRALSKLLPVSLKKAQTTTEWSFSVVGWAAEGVRRKQEASKGACIRAFSSTDWQQGRRSLANYIGR